MKQKSPNQLPVTLLTLIFMVMSFSTLAKAQENETQLIQRGRYVAKIAGCNDCHTPRYGDRNSDVPENQWLTGVDLGYKGAWGTTYPANIRHIVARKSEAEWIQYAKSMKSKPPMPWYNVNAMTTVDLRAFYHFVRSLGDSSFAVPRELKPGVEPKTPYIDFEVVVPANSSSEYF
jgi:mono/diheme cytochrome c family protein